MHCTAVRRRYRRPVRGGDPWQHRAPGRPAAGHPLIYGNHHGIDSRPALCYLFSHIGAGSVDCRTRFMSRRRESVCLFICVYVSGALHGIFNDCWICEGNKNCLIQYKDPSFALGLVCFCSMIESYGLQTTVRYFSYSSTKRGSECQMPHPVSVASL